MIKSPSAPRDLFISAALSGDVDDMKLLLKSVGNVNYLNEEGKSPLISATKNGHLNAVIFLLEEGAEVNFRSNQSDFAAIHWAAYLGHLSIVKALVEASVHSDKSTLNVTCNNNHNALHIAAENGRRTSQIVRYLIEAGADVNSQTSSGNSPLILSLMNNNNEEAKVISDILLESESIDINLSNNKGETALHWASQKNLAETTSALILKFADIDAIDLSGKSPRDYANSEELIAVLDFARLPSSQSLITTSATKLKSSVSLSR